MPITTKAVDPQVDAFVFSAGNKARVVFVIEEGCNPKPPLFTLGKPGDRLGDYPTAEGRYYLA